MCLHTFLQRGRQRRLVSSVWRPGPGSACCLVIMAGGGAGAATRGQDPARVSSTAGTMVQPQPGLVGLAGLGWAAASNVGLLWWSPTRPARPAAPPPSSQQQPVFR